MLYIIFEEGEEPSEPIDCEWGTFIDGYICETPARWVVVNDIGLHLAHLCDHHILQGFFLSKDPVTA